MPELLCTAHGEVVPLVEKECVPGDEHDWWVCELGTSSIEELYISDDGAYIRSTDEDVLVDEVYYDVCDGLTYEEAYAKAKQIVAEYPWEKIIAVHIQI